VGTPEVLAEVVAVQHHRVGAAGPEGPESLFGRAEEGGADAPAAPGGTDREPVQVVAPPVPARDDRADQFTVLLGQDHRLRVAIEQGGHGIPGIGRPGRVLGSFGPQVQDPVDVGRGRRAENE